MEECQTHCSLVSNSCDYSLCKHTTPNLPIYHVFRMKTARKMCIWKIVREVSSNYPLLFNLICYISITILMCTILYSHPRMKICIPTQGMQGKDGCIYMILYSITNFKCNMIFVKYDMLFNLIDICTTNDAI